MLDGFDGLRHHTVVSRNHKNYDVRCLSTASTHHGKCFVARCIEEHDATRGLRIIGIWNMNTIGSDVLRDSACLAFGYIR